MTLRVDVKPELFRWARERAGIDPDALVQRFPKYREWESGAIQPTLKQLERLANVTHAPIGSFFLSEPLQEAIPIPDLRTVANRLAGRPSVDCWTPSICVSNGRTGTANTPGWKGRIRFPSSEPRP